MYKRIFSLESKKQTRDAINIATQMCERYFQKDNS